MPTVVLATTLQARTLLGSTFEAPPPATSESGGGYTVTVPLEASNTVHIVGSSSQHVLYGCYEYLTRTNRTFFFFGWWGVVCRKLERTPLQTLTVVGCSAPPYGGRSTPSEVLLKSRSTFPIYADVCNSDGVTQQRSRSHLHVCRGNSSSAVASARPACWLQGVRHPGLHYTWAPTVSRLCRRTRLVVRAS